MIGEWLRPWLGRRSGDRRAVKGLRDWKLKAIAENEGTSLANLSRSCCALRDACRVWQECEIGVHGRALYLFRTKFRQQTPQIMFSRVQG